MTQDMRAVHDHVLTLLDASRAAAVLDLGCGRGEHLQMLARQVPDSARLVGIDASEKSIEAARAVTAGDPRFTFVVHDLMEGIPFEEGAFDRVLSVNVLEAIPDKATLLQEVHRVLNSEGRLVFSHFDWDSQLYDGVDKAVVRKAVHAFADWKSVSWMADADAWMGRRLWRTFQQTGLFEGQVDACVHTSTTFEPGSYGWERSRDLGRMVKRGMITAEDYQSYLRTLEECWRRGISISTPSRCSATWERKRAGRTPHVTDGRTTAVIFRETVMKKALLAVAGVGGLLAVAGGLIGLTALVAIGAGAMLVCLIILPWLPQDAPPADGR